MVTKKPQPQILTIWRLNLALATVIPALLTSVVLRVYSGAWAVVTAVWVAAFFLLYLVFYPLLYRSMSFTVLEDKLVLRTGVVSKRVVSVPLGAIQFAGIRRTPFERAFGLSSVVVTMAGGRATLAGLTDSDAKSLLGLLQG